MNRIAFKTAAFRGALSAAGLFVVLAAGTAQASGSHAGGHGHGKNIGKPAKASAASRTVTIVMKDSYFEPSQTVVRQGETVRFRIKNSGQLVHEFNIGTPAMHEAHRTEMMQMVERGVLEADRINREAMNGSHGEAAMTHDDPNSVLLEPGQSAEIVWTFDTSATLQFACNVPGHYEAGMVGSLRVRPNEGS